MSYTITINIGELIQIIRRQNEQIIRHQNEQNEIITKFSITNPESIEYLSNINKNCQCENCSPICKSNRISLLLHSLISVKPSIITIFDTELDITDKYIFTIKIYIETVLQMQAFISVDKKFNVKQAIYIESPELNEKISTNSLIYIDNKDFPDNNTLEAVVLLKILKEIELMKIEKKNMFLNITKKINQNINMEDRTLKYKCNLLGKIPRSKMYTKTTCIICTDNSVETQFKNNSCCHSKQICSDCIKTIFLDTCRCPMCNENWYEKYNSIDNYYANKIQRFVKSKIEKTRKRKLASIEEELICYRCATLHNDNLVPNLTHHHLNCQTICTHCEEPDDTPDSTRPYYRHCSSLCPFVEKNETLSNAIKTIPKEYRSQLTFF
jgi:hypothetical protein